jgi:hypothetical protein
MTDAMTMPQKSTLVPSGALVIGGCALFIVAKSMTTGGSVTIEQPVYWLVGLVPFAAWIASEAVKWFATEWPSTLKKIVPLKWRPMFTEVLFDHSMVWLFALIVFVVVHELHLASLVQTPIYEAMEYHNFALTNFILSFLYVGTGFLLWTMFSVLRDHVFKGMLYWTVQILVPLALNVILFFAFVYCIPAV